MYYYEICMLLCYYESSSLSLSSFFPFSFLPNLNPILSRSSCLSFLSFPELQRRPRIRDTRPRMKVNWRTVTAGFALKSALLL